MAEKIQDLQITNRYDEDLTAASSVENETTLAAHRPGGTVFFRRLQRLPDTMMR